MQDCVIMGSVATFDAVMPDKAQAMKVLKEASEVYNVWQAWYECRDAEAKDWCGQALMEECADVVQATANLVKACGCDDMRLHLMDCEEQKPQTRAHHRLEALSRGLRARGLQALRVRANSSPLWGAGQDQGQDRGPK